MDKKNPVLLWMSILAGLQMFLGGAASVSIVAENFLVAQYFALAILAVGAAQGGIQFYVNGKVTPNEDILEFNNKGLVVAGKANEIVPTGTVVREVGHLPEEPKTADVLPMTEYDGPPYD